MQQLLGPELQLVLSTYYTNDLQVISIPCIESIGLFGDLNRNYLIKVFLFVSVAEIRTAHPYY